MLRPPQHRADAPVVFIHPCDDAWDHARIESELKDADDDHTLKRYWGGHSRYDLTPDVQAYLKPDGRPTKFYLRRLPWKAWNEAQGMWERAVLRGDNRPVEAYEHACQRGLERIDGVELMDPTDHTGVSDRDMQRLHDLSTDKYNLILDIGQAVYQASMPMSEAEKKA